MQESSDIKSKLLNSDSLKSLLIESTVFNELKKRKWQTEHSPYFIDPFTKKLRELDIKARKYFQKGQYSCDVDILVECKSLSNYHIIANNISVEENEFDPIWFGNYIFKEFNKLDELLLKFQFTTEESSYIKGKLEEYCIPENTFRWLEYRFAPFDIPTFNTYRETNINTTKDIDNSVVWKCISSLQSAIIAHEELLFSRLEFLITEIVHDDKARLKKIEEIIEQAIKSSNHLFFIHPIIVVESTLWEYTLDKKLTEIKFFRLNIQKFFEEGFWIDVVNFIYLEEYLEKTQSYVDFHKLKKFKS